MYKEAETRLAPLSRVGVPHLVAAIGVLLAAPIPAVLLALLGLPFGVAALVTGAAALASTPWLARRLPATLGELFAGRRALFVIWLAVGLLAVARLAGLAEFMADSSQDGHSALWFDGFYVGHSCFSAYWKAGELSLAGTENLYDPGHYVGTIDRFRLDEYPYPPTFLLLPRLAMVLGGDFLLWRALWFCLDLALLMGSVLAVARWVGGRAGWIVALSLPALLAATPTVLTLQIGNFQLVAFALSLVAMTCFASGRLAAGGALLGWTTVSKLFPGLLMIELLTRRRLSSVAWTAGFMALYGALALAWFGLAPISAFLGFELPRVFSGEAFAWLGNEDLWAVAAINDTIPGLVWKLPLLGLPEPGPLAPKVVGWVYTLLLLALTVLAARRAAVAPRLRQARIWLALLTLAALRSPFQPDAYALFGPLWLLLLLLPELPGRPRTYLGVGLAWIVLSTVLPFSGMPLPGPVGRVLLSLAGQLLGLVLAVREIVRRPPAEAAEVEAAASLAPAAEPAPLWRPV